jgi:hypothetical protein
MFVCVCVLEIGKQQVTVPLPKSLPSGEYLMRVEHIAVHSASNAGGAQVCIHDTKKERKNISA